jgi:hypothetical protein
MILLLGKLPPDWYAQLLRQIAVRDPSVILGPGIGRDCAVIDFAGTQLLVQAGVFQAKRPCAIELRLPQVFRSTSTLGVGVPISY